MKKLAERLSLMVITDPSCGPGRTIAGVVEAAVSAGAPSVQLRAKDEPARATFELALRIREITARHGALFVVNDRVDIAIAAGADGAHLGDSDLTLDAARSIAPADFIIGRSVDTPEEAIWAANHGADYVGAGPVYGTPSKLDTAPPIGMAGISAVRQLATIPVVAIGGLDLTNAEEVARAGAHGIAVIRAVMEAPDPAAATRELLERVARGHSARSTEGFPRRREDAGPP